MRVFRIETDEEGTCKRVITPEGEDISKYVSQVDIEMGPGMNRATISISSVKCVFARAGDEKEETDTIKYWTVNGVLYERQVPKQKSF